VEDTAEIGLLFKNGMYGSVHLDYNQRPSTHTLQIVGTQGSLQWDNADGAVRLYRRQTDSTAPFPAEKGLPVGDQGEIKVHLSGPPGFQRSDLFRAEMLHFLAIVRGQERPVCTLEDGIQALCLALAAHQSANNGQLIEL
jgi:predicted dehydrogenase